jgi:hypothetical protein
MPRFYIEQADWRDGKLSMVFSAVFNFTVEYWRDTYEVDKDYEFLMRSQIMSDLLLRRVGDGALCRGWVDIEVRGTGVIDRPVPHGEPRVDISEARAIPALSRHWA